LAFDRASKELQFAFLILDNVLKLRASRELETRGKFQEEKNFAWVQRPVLCRKDVEPSTRIE
jgi:hypothetical protein